MFKNIQHDRFQRSKHPMTHPLHVHGHRTPHTCVVNSNRCQRCIFIFFSRPTSNHDGPVQYTCRPEPLVVPTARAIFEKRISRCSEGTHRPLNRSETMKLFEINETGKNYACGRLFAVGAFAVLSLVLPCHRIFFSQFFLNFKILSTTVFNVQSIQ